MAVPVPVAVVAAVPVAVVLAVAVSVVAAAWLAADTVALTAGAGPRLAWPMPGPVAVAVTAAFTGAAAVFTAVTAVCTGAAAAFTGATTASTGADAASASTAAVAESAVAVSPVVAGTTAPLTACVVARSAFPAVATVAVAAGASVWLTWPVTEPTIPTAVTVAVDATEVTADVSVPAARMVEPVGAASPDVTARTTDKLVTACVAACRTCPAPVTTVTTAEPGTVPALHAGPPAEGAGRCRLTTGAGPVPGGNPETVGGVGGFGETGGCPPPAGLGTLPPEGPEALPPMLPVRLGSIGGPVGTGCGWVR